MNQILLNDLMAAIVTVSDAMRELCVKHLGMDGEAGAMLMTIGHAQSISITEVVMSIGLTHSGAVRVASKLEAAGLISKSRGDDPRMRILCLTEHGRAVVASLIADRDRELIRFAEVVGCDLRRPDPDSFFFNAYSFRYNS
jgi:DNA-binding MarR family transcriptional regulator